MYRKQNQIMELLICGMDAIAVMVSLMVAGLMRYGNMHALFIAEEMDRLCSVLLLLHVATFYFLKAYDGFFRRGRYKELFFSVKYNIIVIAASTLLSFGMKADIFTSRLVMGYFFVVNTILIWLTHLVIRNWSRIFKRGRIREKNLFIVSTSDQVNSIIKRFLRSKETNWHIAAVAILDGGSVDLSGYEQEIPVISCEEDAYLDYATTHVVDEVFIHADAIQKREDSLKKMILELWR